MLLVLVRSLSFALQIIQYIVSLHHFRWIKALGSEGWAEAPMQRQVSAKQKSLELPREETPTASLFHHINTEEPRDG